MFTLDTSSHPPDQALTFLASERRLRIGFVAPAIVRVSLTQGRAFVDKPSLIVVERTWFSAFVVRETPTTYTLSTTALTVTLDRASGALAYHDADGLLLVREPARGGKWLTPQPVYRNVYTVDEAQAYAEAAQSIDGARADAARSRQVIDRDAFEARLDFVFSPDEALFGLGSHEEGYGNLRGRSRELYQQNMKAVVPCLVSTRGYAVLLDCGSLMTFHDDALGSYWWAEVVDELDFYLIAGATYDDVLGGYYHLTNPVPLPPRWVFGYVQSKERYVNADELLDVAREYRRREIPLDCIVLDWKSWPNGSGWGQKSFDPARFPSPQSLANQLHALGVRLMVSIWPIMTGGCPDQRELLQAGYMLGNQSTYDAFQPAARAMYWQQARRGLFDQGVDAWWCDCTEPFEADWAGAVKPEPHARLALNTAQSRRYLDPGQINAYSLVHSQGIWEGQRAATSTRRVVNLTRSSYAGQHRYGTITWNGDVCATWETLRRIIPEGINFCATGEPYWTTDIGGFFLAHHPDLWFWRGDYDAGTRGLTPGDALVPDPADTGCPDPAFHELYLRWLQYATFLPMMRSHGTDAPREIWRFGEPGTPVYDAIARFIRLRAQLVPYLYSLAAAVTLHGRGLLRAVALDFPHDPATHNLLDQFLLGSALLVCPVTAPALQARPVYLPAGADWFCFWTGEAHPGGRTITAPASLDRIPLYLRGGSILPLGDPLQHVLADPAAPLTLTVYPGADARSDLYEDAGDTYACEHGEYAILPVTWREATGELTLGAWQGSFPQLVVQRDFTLRIVTPTGLQSANVHYTGQPLTHTFAAQPTAQEPPLRPRLIALALLATLPVALPVSAQKKPAPDTVYLAVSPTGSDTADGSPAHPFRTLARAQAAVREQDAQHDVTVRLAEGTWRLTEPLRFAAPDGGRNGYHVTWSAAAGAHPVLSGGIAVTGFRPDESDPTLFVADTPRGLDARQLFIDGQPAPIAQVELPRKDVTFTRTGIILRQSAYPDLRGETRLEVRATGFFTERVAPVERFDGTTLTMRQPSWDNNLWGYDTVEKPFHPETSHLFLLNSLHLLRQPGQWFLDPAQGRLYLRLAPGADPARLHVELPRLAVLVAIAGTLDEPIQNLAFTGIRFSHTSWLGPSGAEGYASQQSGSFLTGRAAAYPADPIATCAVGCAAFETMRNEWSQTPASVQVSAAASIRFEDDVFTELGQYALGIGNDANATLAGVGLATSDITVSRCVFTQLGGGAILAGGVRRDAHHPGYPGFDARMVNRQLVVTNNRIQSIARDYRDHSAILSTYVEGAIIFHNDISDVPYDAIDIGYGWGMHDPNGNPNYRVHMHGYDSPANLVYRTPTTHHDVVVASNRVHGAKRYFHDGGAIYNLSASPGTLITENYIFDNSAQIGLYLDEGSRYITVRRNVVDDPGGEWLNINTVHNALPLRISVDNTATGNWHNGTRVGGLWTNYENDLILDDHLVTGDAWPDEARSVMRNAGIEPTAGPVAYRNAGPASVAVPNP